MRKLFLVCTIAAALFLFWWASRKPATHRMDLTTYFRSGDGLQPGAPVRVDGVDVGSVTSVRVRSELGERPIEVRLRVETPYDLAIPSDSTAQLSTAGVLGPTLVDINTRHAQGTRIGNNGVLGTSEMTDAQASQAMKHLVETITKTPVAAKKPSSSTK